MISKIHKTFEFFTIYVLEQILKNQNDLQQLLFLHGCLPNRCFRVVFVVVYLFYFFILFFLKAKKNTQIVLIMTKNNLISFI